MAEHEPYIPDNPNPTVLYARIMKGNVTRTTILELPSTTDPEDVINRLNALFKKEDEDET